MELTDKKSRLLGLAFLVQFISSFTSGVFMLPRATGVQAFGSPLSIEQIMANIVRNAGILRLDILMDFITAAGVIFLGAMLYSTVRRQNEGMALTAFGLYVLSAALIAVKMTMLYALLFVSRQFLAAEGPASLGPMAGMIYEVIEYSAKMHSLAVGLSLTIFYALLLKTRSVARPLAIWGLVGILGVIAGVTLGLFGTEAPFFFFAVYAPFELVIAIWILTKGVRKERTN